MKRYLIAIFLMLGSLSIFAACGSNCPLANGAIPCCSGFDTNMANINARLWIQGLNNPADGSGTDSDGMDIMDETCTFDSESILGPWGTCGGGNADEYYLFADWLSLNFDGCPDALGTTRAVLLVWDTSGRYILQSKTQGENGGWFSAWDNIGTTVAQPLGAKGEVTVAISDSETPDGDIDTVNFTFSNYFLYGDHDISVPSSPIPTEYRIYFYETAGAVAPAVFDTASWTAGPTYAIGTTTINDLPYTAPADPTHRLYMSISPIYEGTTFGWVSNQPVLLISSSLDPAAAPVISSVSAKASGLNTEVTWKSSDESRVTSYQVYWAPNASAEFAPVGNVVTPTGSNSTYTQSVRIPAQGSYVVKVGANLLDGSVEYSSVASVTPSVVIKDRTRVVPN